ncbi:IclR family transcriptional regulator [Demequina sp. NBRC 110051]|uniref:IclR family transcriptional regulator n=1 Tax=Demequina sp. NBRC 110051 TaxID=1570340 RepID=UPI0013562C82|nr:IclR family transcriptional regulator [Demequina sp. NBRC 110051]
MEEQPRRGGRPAQGEPVLERAVRVLAAFDDNHRHLGLQALAERASLPKSTASRLASTMVSLGLLERGDDGLFGIGLRLWELGSLAESTVSLRTALAPILDDLVSVTHHHVQVLVRDGENGVVLDRRDGRSPLPVFYHVGGHVPLAATAAGRVLLAAAPNDLVQEMLARGDYGWPTFECPRPSATDMTQILTDVRATDVAVVRRPTSPVVSVGVPVRNHRSATVAAIGLLMPAKDVPDASALMPLLQATGRAATRAIRIRLAREVPDWSYD